MADKISDGPVPIGCDNQGAVKLITSGVVKQNSKHIDIRYHHIHDEQAKGHLPSPDMNNNYNSQDLFGPISIPRARAGQVTLARKRGCDPERKNGVLEKETSPKDKCPVLRNLNLKFLHHVGKCESALFFLLASVFPTGFSLQRF
jgi:hypothetical protein